MKFSRVCLKLIRGLRCPTLIKKLIIRRDPALSFASAKSTVYETNSLHFKGMLISSDLLFLVNLMPDPIQFEFKKKSEGVRKY